MDLVTHTRQALVYGDVNLNILDGSAIWVQSMCEALSRVGVDTRVLLKAPIETDRLVAPLRELPRVSVIDPFRLRLTDEPTPLSPALAVDILSRLDKELSADLIVVRGLRLATTAARTPSLSGRLWTYLTDMPHNVADLNDEIVERLTEVAAASRLLLCQTEELRSFLESAIPMAAGRCVLWSPVVPAPSFTLPDRSPLVDATTGAQLRPLQLSYTGKYAADWNTLEMTRLPAMLDAVGISAELHMVGDKIHDEPNLPGWSEEMHTALDSTPGVVWHGGVSRQEAMRLSANADLGLSWRATNMDASLELSTKVLEFASLGVPVLVNRTPMHEALFGADYPLFVTTEADITGLLSDASALPELLAKAAQQARDAIADYTMDAAVERMAGMLNRTLATSPTSHDEHLTHPLKVLIVSHDLKFFTRIQEHLAGLASVNLRVDAWPALAQHDEATSRALNDWADVVICEWAGPNLVWYSKNKRPGQRLITRLHRFELSAGWLADVDIDAVDQVICVSPHYAQLTAEQTGWPKERIVVIPNWVDIEQFERPKLPGAAFTLGMIGISPIRKRPDLGVEVLSQLRRRDSRFTLAVKSKMPWDYWWIWRKPEERIDTERLMSRLRDDATVRGAVSFDGFGGDVAVWLRRVGWVLSTSEDESFHLAPAEGMASRAVPALLPWPGADTIYDPRWISATAEEMAETILDVVRSGSWQETADIAHAQVRRSFPLPQVCDEWAEILRTDADPRSAHTPLYPND